MAQPLPALKEPPDCGSMVVVRCDREGSTGNALRLPLPSDALELDRIVIEADPVRRTLQEALAPGFSTRPRAGTRTFAIAEGSQCTCMNVCPPVPLPCCQCSVPMNRYSAMPGASPLQ